MRKGAQRDHLAAVGDHRAEQADQGTDRKDPEVTESLAAADRHHRGQQHRCHDAGHGETVEALPAPAGLRAEQDVRRPGCTGQQREQRRRRRSRSARSRPSSATPSAASTTQTRSRARREPSTASASGPMNSMVTAMPERDPGERLVDRPVHQRRGSRRKRARRASRCRFDRAAPVGRPRPGPVRSVTSRSHTIVVGVDLVEQVLGQPGAELHGQDADQHQPDR